jgi:TrmH family RNA methyltransferase
MVNEAIKYNQPIEYIVKAEGFNLELLPSSCTEIIVSGSVFSHLSDEKTPQGVLAVIKVSDLSVKKPLKNALFLDGIQDPGNLGTIIRTAAASGYKDIYLVSCVDPYSPKVVRSSMSGIYFVNLYKGDYVEVFDAIKNLDLIVADMNGESVFDYKPKNDYCIAVGNEANGVSQIVKDKASVVLSIPMEKNVESLNAAVAISLMMYKLKY